MGEDDVVEEPAVEGAAVDEPVVDEPVVDEPVVDEGVGASGATPGAERGAIPGAAVKRAVEAIVMVADSPVEVGVLAQLVEVAPAEIEQALAELADEHHSAGRGFELVAVAGGWRYQSHPDMASYVERFVLEGQTARLSAAALETLAIVAYKQPISRAQVATIRGVSVDGVVRTLEQRGYISEVARDPGPGQAILFGTTPLFLDKLGLSSLSDLPAIADFVPGADVVEALEHGLRVEEPPAERLGADRTVAERFDAELADELSREPYAPTPTGPGPERDHVHGSADVVDIDLRDDGAGAEDGTDLDEDDDDQDEGGLEDLDLAGGDLVNGGSPGHGEPEDPRPDTPTAGSDAPSWG
jgi:segregation and condensation protein B